MKSCSIFYEVSVEEAKEDAAKAIQEHRESLSQMLEDHKAARRQSAEAEVKAEAEACPQGDQQGSGRRADHSQARLVQKTGRAERNSFL